MKRIYQGIVVIVFISIISGGLIGCGQKSQPVSVNSLPPTSSLANNSSSSEEIPTVGNDVMKEWKTYRNEKMGIEVQYPTGLQILEVSTSSAKQAYSQVKLGFDMSAYKNTNLREVTIFATYSPVTGECLKKYQMSEESKQKIRSFPMAEKVVINDMTLYKTREADAGAGNTFEYVSYATLHNGKCYSADLVLHSVNPLNYDVSNRPTEFDPAPFEDTFDKMIARVKFLN